MHDLVAGRIQRLRALVADLLEKATFPGAESVVTIDGQVVARSAETVNDNLSTGQIEVRAGRDGRPDLLAR